MSHILSHKKEHHFVSNTLAPHLNAISCKAPAGFSVYISTRSVSTSRSLLLEDDLPNETSSPSKFKVQLQSKHFLAHQQVVTR